MGIGSRSVKILALDLQGFFGNTELSWERWTVIAGISGLDDSPSYAESASTRMP